MACIVCDGTTKHFLTTQLLELTYCTLCFHIHVRKNELDLYMNNLDPVYNEDQDILINIIKHISENDTNDEVGRILIIHPEHTEINTPPLADISTYANGKDIAFLRESQLATHTTLHGCIVLYGIITHTPLLTYTMNKCRTLLQTDGRLYVHTKLSNLIRSPSFYFRDFFTDTQQISIFSANSFRTLSESNGLYLEDVRTFGQSRFYKLTKQPLGSVCRNLANVFVDEIEAEIYSPVSYMTYELKYTVYKYILQTQISQTRLMGYDMVSYFSNDYLDFFEIPTYLIDHYINDIDTLHQLHLGNPNLLVIVFDLKGLYSNAQLIYDSLTRLVGGNVLNAYVLNCM
jgi:hypothetical protein